MIRIQINKFIVFLCFISTIIGCQEQNNTHHESSSQLPVRSDLSGVSNIFELIDDIQIFELKSPNLNGIFFFQPIKKILYHNGYYYLLSIEDELYKTDTEGNLVSVLSDKGDGPDQYREIKDFDLIDESLYIHDYQKQRFHIYDLNFKKQRTRDVGFNFMSFKLTDKDIFLFTAKHRNKIDQNIDDYDLLNINYDFKIKEKYIPFDYEKFQSFRIHNDNPFYKYKDDVFFNDLLSDTIYRLSSGGLEKFKSFKYFETLSGQHKIMSHENLVSEMTNNPGKFEAMDFFATLKGVNKYFFIYNFSKGGKTSVFSFYARKSNTLKNYIFPKNYSDLEHKSIFELTTTNNKDEFVAVVYPYVLNFIKSEYLKSNEKISKNLINKIDGILKNSVADGNQILIKYKLKQF